MRYFRSYSLMLLLFFAGFMVLSVSGCGKKGAKEQGKTAGTVPTAGNTQTGARPVPSTAPITEERTFYDFEYDLQGWEIPMWAMGKSDYVAKDAKKADGIASHGNSSMEITTDLPGGHWTAALVEIQQYLDLSGYRVIMADVYMPKDAPMGLKAKMILTVGSNWKFVEMASSVPLMPGKWVTIKANIEPGSYDWKRVVPDEEFAKDVRKIAIRIESNNKPQYSGSVYIDNIRCGR